MSKRLGVLGSKNAERESVIDAVMLSRYTEQPLGHRPEDQFIVDLLLDDLRFKNAVNLYFATYSQYNKSKLIFLVIDKNLMEAFTRGSINETEYLASERKLFYYTSLRSDKASPSDVVKHYTELLRLRLKLYEEREQYLKCANIKKKLDEFN